MATRKSPKKAATKAPRPPELPGHGDDEPTKQWTLRLLAHSNVYARLSAYSDELAVVLGAIGMKQKQGDKPEPAAVARHVSRLIAEGPRKEPGEEAQLLGRNVAMLGDLLGLDGAEREVLRFAAMTLHRSPLRACMRSLERMTPRGLGILLSKILGTPEQRMIRALEMEAPLRKLGLLRLDRSAYVDESPLLLLEHLDEQLFEAHEDVHSLLQGFARLARPSQLTREDYPHLTADLSLLERLLRAAIDRQEVGVNVLLHGPSGTGKTELARVLAASVRASLHDVRVEGLDGKVLGAYERLAAYQLCQRLASRSRPALVLFDEVEDIFKTAVHELFDAQAGAGHDKGYMTRLLEENPVPALWVCNSIEAMDPAILRRFDLVLEVPTPPERVRRAILQRYLGPLEVQPAWLDRMSSDESLTPAHAERAVRAARLIGCEGADETTQTLDRVLRSSLAVTRTTPAPSRRQMALGYDLTLLRTDPPLEPLVASLERRPAATICLYGPPGTGKTAFATYLARRLQRPLLLRRASELLGPYVGQTEANLAGAFQRATQDGAVLFLDEVDSFLQRREMADRQWEITQVNELLTQMDTFDGVFICATNRIEHLDPSSLRRFDLRVRFLFLEKDQRHSLFSRALAELGGEPPGPLPASVRAALDRLSNVTPGDFAVVVRRARILGTPAAPEALLAALEAEAQSKNEGMKTPLGFSGV